MVDINKQVPSSFHVSGSVPMRLQLSLATYAGNSLLPVNYQYPLSAVIYRITQQADEKYTAFLHDQGYRLDNGKSFKLFSFSDLRVHPGRKLKAG